MALPGSGASGTRTRSGRRSRAPVRSTAGSPSSSGMPTETASAANEPAPRSDREHEARRDRRERHHAVDTGPRKDGIRCRGAALFRRGAKVVEFAPHDFEDVLALVRGVGRDLAGAAGISRFAVAFFPFDPTFWLDASDEPARRLRSLIEPIATSMALRATR